MTNKTVTLSRELTDKIESHLDLRANFDPSYPGETMPRNNEAVLLLELRAALADPVPPAGGEVEVLGYQVTRTTPTGNVRLDRPLLSKVLDGWEPAFKVVELVDRAHVTRLQAELHEMDKKNDQLLADRSRLQAEVESLQLEFMTKDAEIKLGDEYAAYMDKRCAAEAEVERLSQIGSAYDEAISASNELGYAAMCAADVIRHQADELTDLQAVLTKALECLSTANDKLRRQDIASQYKDGQTAKHEGELAMLQAELTKVRELVLKLANAGSQTSGFSSNLMREARVYLAHQSAPAAKDDDWQMNPCKQGHRDIGAAGGVAHCYTCDEKITAATTQEAFEQWNAAHPAVQSLEKKGHD
ncbi:hypothetical protein [Pseudomonas sp. 7SR1]|uniref:hypothetical protein n=1 Tax=Pseudomonas sp. 7SR1 TaxID=1881017 RepID=UPI0009537F50|nr:hypothetical protein [Pseudomonas sp. 7SR1]ROO33429.1 hypothetical protein BIV09_23895 [Pseudomonas sp. 7SR1]SIS23070.1 hypothetical protein SAMN05428955_3406 [Pseudomonas sp. 7SR1]